MQSGTKLIHLSHISLFTKKIVAQCEEKLQCEGGDRKMKLIHTSDSGAAEAPSTLYKCKTKSAHVGLCGG